MNGKRFLLWTGMIFFVTECISWVMQQYFSNSVVVNRSALFGLVDSNIGVVCIVLIGASLFWQIARSANKNSEIIQWGTVLIFVGALSNILERIIYGGVIDYIHFLSLSVFNIADVQIVIGALLLAFEPQLTKKR